MHGHDLLLAVTVGLAAGVAALVVFRRLGIGSILGLLVTGILVGPWGIGLGESSDQLLQLTELGVVFLLFVIGLEMEPRALWSMRRAVFGLGSLQILMTGIILSGLFTWTLATSWQAGLIAGFGLALSSTAFGMRLLEERSELQTEHGRNSIAVLLMQDLAVVPILTLVPILAGSASAEDGAGWWGIAVGVVMLIAVYLLGRYALPAAFDLAANQRNVEAFAALAALGVLAAASAMAVAGLSQAMGAFIVGMLLSRSRYHHQVEAEVTPFKGWLLSLFFVSIGMTIDLGRLVDNGVLVLALLLLLIAVKAGVILGLGWLFAIDRGARLRMACLLSQGGEFGFVIFGAARAAGVFNADLHTIGILVISLSMAATPFLVRLGDRLATKLAPQPALGMAPHPAVEAGRHVVLAGYGRVGQTVAAMLETASVPYLAVDLDPNRIVEGRRRGRPVVYGNAGDPRLLDIAGVGRAAMVVVTLDNPAVAERVVSAVRTFHPDVRIIARARDSASRERMLRAGVSDAFPELVEMSLALAAAVLRGVGCSEAAVHDAAERLRAENLRLRT